MGKFCPLSASTNIFLKRRDSGNVTMGEPNQKKDKNGRITEKVANRFVLVMLLLSEIIFADWWYSLLSHLLTCPSMFFSCCPRTKASSQPDHDASEPKHSTRRPRYLGCLTKRQLAVTGVYVGLFVLLIISAATAVVLTKKSGTCSNIFKAQRVIATPETFIFSLDSKYNANVRFLWSRNLK